MEPKRKQPFHKKTIRTFELEELLEREPIVLDQHNISGQIRDSIVLVTGAAGSIGSELATQICEYTPKRLILVDQSETALNDLDLTLTGKFNTLEILSYVASINDISRMTEIFSRSQVQILFHAAAYKHVPFMEKHPYEAIKTNVLGTTVLADLAITFHVKKFIFISTDKAVNPSSVMGATKRLAEIYLQNLNQQISTRFIITRFGNVLGSNGSFIRTFENQIRQGGPITITHPNVTRYIMTVREACQLVLEASATGKNMEILFFDMGQPVRIADIAKQMIILSGLRPYKDVMIEYVGLRPGEKICEELFTERRDAVTRCHPKIHSMSPGPIAGLDIPLMIKSLTAAMESGEPEKMVGVLKLAIPEYISRNSQFVKLDSDHLKE
ncbi:polysaccharide biosynthesis protein [Dyadobacter bucti]|uniref:polysaccharide biosynthesis protein n=1 Tax=Dyadobacter bucti TaxID=2572203 RepID=UPI0011092274|nr:polysaccharide biosynthesis protein [Dyadobacter bucti]